MFTGIIQSIGHISALDASRLSILKGPDFASSDLQLGESIAINGVCLTLVAQTDEGSIGFEVSPETLSRSALGDLRPGDPVNLERAMSALGRFGGHIVQGHVDATGVLAARHKDGEFEVLGFKVPIEFDRFLIDKGSIAIDGVSLTVVEPQKGAFDVWAVPHTLSNTNLGSLKTDSRVNLEFDVLAKYVEKLLVSRLDPGRVAASNLADPGSVKRLPAQG